jgi:hypothetical protein
MLLFYGRVNVLFFSINVSVFEILNSVLQRKFSLLNNKALNNSNVVAGFYRF